MQSSDFKAPILKLKEFVKEHSKLCPPEDENSAGVSDIWLAKIVFRKGRPRSFDERENLRKNLYRLLMKIPGMERKKEISLKGFAKELDNDMETAVLAFGLGELLDLFTVMHPKKGLPNLHDTDVDGLAQYGFVSFIMDEELEELDEWYDTYNV